ncbi:MAG: hypothetical protein RRY34_04300 [Victivallaceae bacterium]
MNENNEITALFNLLDDKPEIANSALQRLLKYPIEVLEPFLAQTFASVGVDFDHPGAAGVFSAKFGRG